MAELQPQTAAPIVELVGVARTFQHGDEPVHVLDDLALDIAPGAFIAFMGPSGSGKTTLLNLIAGLDRPTRGTVQVAGQELGRLDERALARFRADKLGLVFQTYNLMPVLTAVENVELPLALTRLPKAERRKRAETALRVVGLDDRMSHYPRQLSGGQQQRVAIARAIVNDPQILLADEPTGDLDRKSADDVLLLLERLNKEFGKTILMVTHDPAAAGRAGSIRRMDKGKLQ